MKQYSPNDARRRGENDGGLRWWKSNGTRLGGGRETEREKERLRDRERKSERERESEKRKRV